MSHGWCQLAPFEFDAEATELRRAQLLPDGTGVVLTFRPWAAGDLLVTVKGASPQMASEQGAGIREITRRIFRLDLDLRPLYARIEGEPRYAWVEAAGAGRFLRCPTVWEDLVKILLTTNISWSGTKGMVERLVALGPVAAGGRRAFPEPTTIAPMNPGELSKRVRTGYRTDYLHTLATKVASGKLDLESWVQRENPVEDLAGKVENLRGFGQYSAHAAAALFGRFDGLPLDSAARAMFAREFLAGSEATDDEIREHYRRYGRWQGAVMWLDLMGPPVGSGTTTADL